MSRGTEVGLGEIKNLVLRDGLSYNLYFTRKLRAGYTSYAPNIDNQIFEDLANLISGYLEGFVGQQEAQYNPTGYLDGTIETCDCDYVGNYQEVIDSFERADTVETEIDPDNFTFYCLEVYKAGDPSYSKIRFFRRVTKFKKLHSRGIIAKFNGNQLNKLEARLIGIDGEVDFICVNDRLLVLSHYSLERIFRLDEKFIGTATEFLKEVEEQDCIENYEQFFEDCVGSVRIRKTLAKMKSEEINLAKTLENEANIETTIDMFDLDVEVQKSPKFKILYTNKDQLLDILRILRDSYYKSMINEDKGIDDRK